MLRCTVHNLITDQRYAFEAPDQAAVDAKLLAKEKVYGRPAWTDTTVEPPVEHASERDVEVTDITAELAAAAAETAARPAAVAFLRNIDFDTASIADLRTAMKAQWVLIKHLYRDQA